MLHRPERWRRRGAALVEGAMVYVIVVLLTIGAIVAGLGVYRYEQVASLAREGSRWICVHGSNYSATTGNAAASSTDLLSHLQAESPGLDPKQLSVAVYLISGGTKTSWDSSSKAPYTLNAIGEVTGQNLVTVVVTYTWQAEALFGTTTMTSTSTVPMCF
jgi:hypothetical protein